MMINRVRTLLLNRGREGYIDDPGEEYIDASFRRRRLSPEMLRVWRVLFGQSPDRLFLNFRVRQLMNLLHATPLASDTGDPGLLTYLPFRTDLSEAVFSSRVVRPTSSTPRVYIIGGHTADESRGHSSYSWRVQRVSTDQVTVTQQYPSPQTSTVSVTFSNGLSSAIPLSSSPLTTRFTEDGVEFAYTVESAAKPVLDLAIVVQAALLQLGDDATAQLFNSDLSDRQLQYYMIWRDHPHFPMRAAAALLAFANYVEAQEVAT